MATFISLMSFTEEGIRGVKETGKRADAFIEMAKAVGVTVKDVYWTVGSYDGVLILDAPDEETAAALLASTGSKGNVRTQTMRAFSRSEIDAVLAKVS